MSNFLFWNSSTCPEPDICTSSLVHSTFDLVQSTMPRKSGGGSSSGSGGTSGGTVNVSGYYRSNGTYVSGYTRAAPSSSSSSSGTSGNNSVSGSSSGSGTVNVSGYTRSNGTYVSGYTRSAPSNSTSSSGKSGTSSVSGSCSGSGTVNVSGYYRSNGTYVSGYTRSAPFQSTSPTVSSSVQKLTSSSSSFVGVQDRKCYVDNAVNRKLGRVGKPLGQHVVHKDGSMTKEGLTYTQSGDRCYKDNAHNRHLGRVGLPIPTRRNRIEEIAEKYTLEEAIALLQRMGFEEDTHLEHQYAVDRLHREDVEEGWSKMGLQPSTDESKLPPLEECCKIAYSDLQLKQQIGRGGFGEVFAGCWNGTPIAYKKLFLQQMSKKRLESFKTEVTVFSTLKHPNTVKMFGVVAEEGNLGIVMEYLTRSLYRAIFFEDSEFSYDQKQKIVYQVADALNYLHVNEGKTIAHGDVKSENILLDVHNNAKLGDFGLSTLKNDTASSRSSLATAAAGQGTPRYSAPEVLRGEVLNVDQLLKTDMYSLAVVVFEILAEEEPFEGLNPRQLERKVDQENARPTTKVPLSDPIVELLSSCWNRDATQRPTAAQFKERWTGITHLYKGSHGP